jgi:hypothetical protein
LKRELQLRLVNAERRRMLVDAGVWVDDVRRSNQWSLTLNDDFD